MRNKYLNRSKISAAKFRQFLRYFALDLQATQIAVLCSLNRNTVNRLLKAVRQRIAEFCEAQAPFTGEIEVDESYFGAKHQHGKRGRGAYGKTIIFGIFKRNGKVYTQIVPNVSRRTLQAVIQGRATRFESLKSVIHSDTWGAYDGLVDLGYRKHYRINHSKGDYAKGNVHINGIEGFWGFAKTRLVKFRGMHKQTFYLHLKECEFRFNYRHEDLYYLLLEIIKNHPLF